MEEIEALHGDTTMKTDQELANTAIADAVARRRVEKGSWRADGAQPSEVERKRRRSGESAPVRADADESDAESAGGKVRLYAEHAAPIGSLDGGVCGASTQLV